MKQLIITILLAAGLFTGFDVGAQIKFKTTQTATGVEVDTMRNSETSYLYTMPVNGLVKYESGGYVIQYNVVNDSATTAITATLESSLDGVNWLPHYGSDTGVNGLKCDVKTLTGSTVHKWVAYPGAIQTVNANGRVVHTNASRTLNFRIKQVHGNGGKSHATATVIPQTFIKP